MWAWIGSLLGSSGSKGSSSNMMPSSAESGANAGFGPMTFGGGKTQSVANVVIVGLIVTMAVLLVRKRK
jgi:hypothetical protein